MNIKKLEERRMQIKKARLTYDRDVAGNNHQAAVDERGTSYFFSKLLMYAGYFTPIAAWIDVFKGDLSPLWALVWSCVGLLFVYMMKKFRLRIKWTLGRKVKRLEAIDYAEQHKVSDAILGGALRSPENGWRARLSQARGRQIAKAMENLSPKK